MLFGSAALGKRDVTPNAVNWLGFTIVAPDTEGTTTDETLSGFVGSITLAVSWGGSGLTMEYRLDSGTWTSITNGGTLSIATGQTLGFRGTRGSNGSNTVTVANQSDGSAPLDTFVVERTP